MNLKHNIKIFIYTIFLTTLIQFALSGCQSAKVLEFSGNIESTQIDCNSEAGGKVVKLEKEEGSQVKAGDVVAVLDSSLQELTVKQQEAIVKIKQAKLEELKAGTRPEQLEQAEASVRSAELAVKNAGTGIETANTGYNYWLDKYENFKSLYKSNSASENDLQDAKYKLDTARQQLEVAKKQQKSAQAQLESTQAQLTLLKKGATSQTITAAEADLEQSNIQLAQAKLALSKYQIKAPTDGTIIIRNIELGDMVNTGTNIATISDLSKLWVKVYIEQKNLKYVSLGQELDLKVSSSDNKMLKGKVVYISEQAEYTPKNVETSDAKENTVFKVKIKLPDNIGTLKPGMTATAMIPLGE